MEVSIPYVYYNPNPNGKNVGDCVIRAISKATNMDWESVYTGICVTGYSMCDMPSANCVWGSYLRYNGFVRDVVPNECPECYSVRPLLSVKSAVFVLWCAVERHKGLSRSRMDLSRMRCCA